MSVNKNGNVYTVVYLIVLVIIVGAALAFAALGLKGRQQANADADKMRQILAAAHLAPAQGQTVENLWAEHIEATTVVNSVGESVADAEAFTVNMAKQAKLPADKRALPVFECMTADGIKYILPLAGNGLWGPIWGYVALNADGSTIYGAYFAHQGETPGLGAEIEKPAFQNEFSGKVMFKDGKFMPVEVVKKGLKPAGDADYVDGISGGTITSKGVGAMLDNCLAPYEAFLRGLQQEGANNSQPSDNE